MESFRSFAAAVHPRGVVGRLIDSCYTACEREKHFPGSSMQLPPRSLKCQLLMMLGLALFLAALLLQMTTLHHVLAAVFLLPFVLLFGLVLVPPSLWPAFAQEERVATSVLCRTERFQRPPPSFQN